MTGVRLSCPRRMSQPCTPCRLAHVGIAHVIMDVRELLRLRVARPQTLRPPEIGDSGIGRNACPGENDDVGGSINPIANGLSLIRHSSEYMTRPERTLG